jgi:glycosyltransferase involved in cell wall biosynthesis
MGYKRAMSVAIHYSAIRAPQDSKTIYGLQIAVEDWLRAHFRYGQTDCFSFLVGDAQSRDEVLALAASCGVDQDRLSFPDARFPRENCGAFSTIFRPDLDPHDLFWQRALLKQPGFSFCGLAHAVAGFDGGAILNKYVHGPSGAGDAIICPSRAIRSVVERFFDIAGETVARRFNGAFKSEIALPVIPLGIDTSRIEARVSPEKRKAQREALALAEDEVAILWVGRLSAAIKAHPLPMFRAAEEAAKRTGKKIRLLMLGYFVPEEAARDFEALAQDICKTARVTFVAHNDPRFPEGLWAAGDVFLSLIDSVQESFGLTPIEAIAAGLPRVVSDWDGYRDHVRHGEDGFLIPTIQPPTGTGAELSQLFLGGREMYGGALAKTALSIAVDHEAAAAALVALIENPDRARKLAEKAKARLETYAWKNIIPAYENLWSENAARRRAAEIDPRPWPAVPPEAPDVFTLYESFPSQILKNETRLRVAATKAEIKSLWSHGINVLAADLMIAPDAITTLINRIAAQKTLSVEDCKTALPASDPARLYRTLTWLLKLGILAKTNPGQKAEI